MLDRAVLAGLRELDDDTGGIAMLFQLFIEHTTVRLAALREACGAADRETMRAVGHSLKGSSSTLGASRLADLSTQLEDAADEPDLGAAGLLLDRMDAEFELVKTALAADFRITAAAAAPTTHGSEPS